MNDTPTEPAALPVLSPADIMDRLARDLPHWQLVEGALQRRYRTAGWKGSLMLANTIGHLAEVAWHHPDLLLSYPQVVVRLSTHDAGGVTERDFALARQIEAVIGWRPADEPGGWLEGTPAGNAAAAYIVRD